MLRRSRQLKPLPRPLPERGGALLRTITHAPSRNLPHPRAGVPSPLGEGQGGVSRLTLLLACAVLVLSCKRCSHEPTPPSSVAPSELLVRQVDGVVGIPVLSRLGAGLSQLSQLKLAGLGAALAGEGDANQALADLRTQLGFDPTTPAGLSSVGLDPQGTLLAATLPDGNAVAVLPIGDEGRFDTAVSALAKQRIRSPVRVQEGNLTRFTSISDPNQTLVYGMAGHYAVFSFGKTASIVVRAAFQHPAAQSLSADPAWAALLAASTEDSIIAYAPATSHSAQEAGLSQGISARLQVEPHGLRAVVDLPLTATQGPALRMAPGAGQELLPALDPDAVLVARVGAEPGALWPLLEPQLPVDFRRELLAAGLKAGEILSNLKPGVALSLALPDKVDLSHLPSFDPRETNPFRYVYLAGVGHVKNAAAAHEALESARKFGAQLGANLKTHQLGSVPVYTFTYALGEGASVALDGDAVAVSGGEGRLEPLLSRMHGTDGGASTPPTSPPELNGNGSAVYVNLDRVAERLRALPNSAFGLGGFAIRAALMRWVDAVNDLHSLSITANVKENQLTLELRTGLP